MSYTRTQYRQETARLLAGTQAVTSATTADGAATGLTLIDYAYKSSSIQDNHFVGYVLYITSGMWIGLWRRVAGYDASEGQFTVDYGFQLQADGTGVAVDATSLTDARQAWTVNLYVGATVTCDSKTLVVTSNTATKLTGASWTGGTPTAGAYTVNYPVKSGVTYEMHGVTDPISIHNGLDRAFRKLLYPTLAVPSALNDADMEASSNGWTAGSGCTLTRTTTAGEFFRGLQANKVLNTGAAASYAYQRINAVAGDTGYVVAVCRNNAITTSCKLVVYDYTNSAEIDSETSAEFDWQSLGIQFTVPTDCHQVEFRLENITATTNAYSMWDQVQLFWSGQRRYAMPSWITEKWQVGKTGYQLEGPQLAADGHMIDRTPVTRWEHIHPKKELGTVYIAPDPPFRNNSPVYVECLRPYAALSSDSSTCDADLDWVAAKAKYECLRMLAPPFMPAGVNPPSQKALDEAKMEATAADARFMPKIEQTWGFGEETLFSLQQV